MRIGLGCMRLSTDPARDETLAIETLRAAVEVGISVFDTARAYGLDDEDAGHNERWLARAVDRTRARVVTKCGMRRPNGAWQPDGRAVAIAEDVRASREVLGTIDLLLLHAPDPRVPFATSVRALSRALDEGVRAIGLSNVTIAQLEEARRIAPISAVEIALGAFDDEAARGGIVARCAAHGIEVLAHSPLGGPKRAPRLARDRALQSLARAIGATPAEIVLAYLLHVHPSIVPLVGARSPRHVASAALASRLELDDATLRALDERFPGLASLRRSPPRPLATATREVTLLMGLAGAGKSRLVRAWTERGYLRLNRDEKGGTLRDLSRALELHLAEGHERVVLDNTYLTRASRADVIAAAHRQGARVRCVHLDTPLHEAQINVVLRMLERHGRLLDPDELARAARKDPNMLRPTVLFRMARELEPPALDEGFFEIEVLPFVRERRPGAVRSGGAIALDRLDADDAPALRRRVDGPCLVFGFREGASDEDVEAIRARLAPLDVEVSLCTHAAGPPVCWCRPPLPGLFLAFAERHALDPNKSVLLGASPAHVTMGRALGFATIDA